MLKQFASMPVACLLALLLGVHGPSALAQQDKHPEWPRLSEAVLEKVPPDLREMAQNFVRFSADYQKRFVNLSGEERRERILKSLMYYVPQAVDLVLDKLPKEPTSTRMMILTRITRPDHYGDHWRLNPKVYPVLEQMIVSDPEVEVVQQALESLRRLRMQGMRALLTKRLMAAQRGGDQEAVGRLAEEQERWISLERGVMLPAFLRVVPPPFSLKAAGQPVRVLAFGDFGTGKDEQKRVAAAMLQYHQRTPFDFGITLGDNFYPRGMESPQDPRWETWWELVYKPLGLKLYASLGNHDWAHTDSPAAEILYSQKSETWRMPAPYYTFTAGPTQFFALDTNDISEAQLTWLKEELNKSRARWKVVYGHHPIYRVLEDGREPYDEKMVKTLLPILRGLADIFLAGHQHNLQHLRQEGGVHFIVSGGGGAAASNRSLHEQEPRALYAKSINGFTVLEANERELTFRHVGADSKELYSYTLRK